MSQLWSFTNCGGCTSLPKTILVTSVWVIPIPARAVPECLFSKTAPKKWIGKSIALSLLSWLWNQLLNASIYQCCSFACVHKHSLCWQLSLKHRHYHCYINIKFTFWPGIQGLWLTLPPLEMIYFFTGSLFLVGPKEIQMFSSSSKHLSILFHESISIWKYHLPEFTFY